MKIALCSTYVPFVLGGARNIVDWLEASLREAGHEVEKVYLPQVEDVGSLFQQMAAFRWIDLDMADRVVCFRPQAHLLRHPHKILWFIHHIRLFYDLWDTPYRLFPDDARHRAFRNALRAADDAGLREARAIFTNSEVVSKRLKTYNKVESEVLYPPVFQPERFYCKGFNDEIVGIWRMEHHKRPHLLIEAMARTRTPVRLRLSGAAFHSDYLDEMSKRIAALQLSGRVIMEGRWISEEEKIDLLANCLATAYIPHDEDSYGYPSVESSHALKPILTASDSGGVLELVQHGINGYVVEPSPQALAEAMDMLYLDRVKTCAMGRNASARLAELDISWSHVLQRLLA